MSNSRSLARDYWERNPALMRRGSEGGTRLAEMAGDPTAFVALVRSWFPPDLFAGLAIRTLTPPNSPLTTLVYLHDAVDEAELERVVLTPLSAGWLAPTPQQLAQSGRFPTGRLQVLSDPEPVHRGLLGGAVALHLAGQGSVLLVSAAGEATGARGFDTNLSRNVGQLVRLVASPALRVERRLTKAGNEVAVVYMEGTAGTALADAVLAWGASQESPTAQPSAFQSLLGVFRLPPALEGFDPHDVARALRKGYVALLTSSQPKPRVAPTTLGNLLSGAGDATLPPNLRRVVKAPRLAILLWGTLAGAGLIAVAEYHHALIPGPFLIALAASRQNMPFPIVLEFLMLEALADLTHAAAMRVGGQRAPLFAKLALLLEIMITLQVGMSSAVSGFFCFTGAIARLALPNPALRLTSRTWRYLFIAAATGLGVYGLTLMIFAAMVYLGQESTFDHPLHMPLEETAP